MQAAMTLRGKFITLMVGASLLTTVGVGAVFINNMWGEADRQVEYSGTFVKTKIDEFLNVSGSRHCSIEQQCREVALCWRDVPDG